MHEPVPDHSLREQFPRILAAACAGGEWAWRELYDAIAPQLTRYLRARGVPEPDDVVGETFVKVVRYIDGFEGDEAAFRTWVFTIGRNLVVDDLRKRTRRPVDVVTDDQLAAAGPRGDAEDDAMRDLAVAHVEEILEHLSADQRDVLLLRILGGPHDPRDRSGRGQERGSGEDVAGQGSRRDPREDLRWGP